MADMNNGGKTLLVAAFVAWAFAFFMAGYLHAKQARMEACLAQIHYEYNTGRLPSYNRCAWMGAPL